MTPPRVGGRPAAKRRATALVPLSVRWGVRLRASPTGFQELCRDNPDLRLERTARGFLEVMSPASAGTGKRNFDLSGQLYLWSKADGTGHAFDSSAGFTLPNGAVRSPDASWIAGPRWDALTLEQKEVGFAPVYPDFVAELRSRSDGLPRLRKKLEEYLAQGARLGWLIDPLSGEVEIYRPGRPAEVLKRPETLSGEDVLPGFVLDLKGILSD